MSKRYEVGTFTPAAPVRPWPIGLLATLLIVLLSACETGTLIGGDGSSGETGPLDGSVSDRPQRDTSADEGSAGDTSAGEASPSDTRVDDMGLPDAAPPDVGTPADIGAPTDSSEADTRAADQTSPAVDTTADARVDRGSVDSDGGQPSVDVAVVPGGRTFYVAPLSTACTPSTPGSGSLNDPFANLYYAATQGGLACGDVLMLRAGVYRNRYGGFSPDGTEAQRFAGCDDDRQVAGYDGDHTLLPLFFACPADKPLVIQNFPGEEAILDGSDADLASAGNWTRCESSSQCGPATGLSLQAYNETYYTTAFNVSNADTAQMWIDPTDTTPGVRIGWWANRGDLQASDSAADHDSLPRGRFFSVASGDPIIARLPDGSDPNLHDVHLTCQIGDCASAVIAVTEAASHVVVRRNPAGGALRLRYGYHVIRIDAAAHDLLFDGLDVMGGGGRDYGGCLRTNAGHRIRFTNGTCQETMGEGIAFYGGGPVNGQQVSGMVLAGSVVRNTGRGWIDGGGLGSSLGMSVILKNCNDCEVRGNTLESTFRDGVWITTSEGGCGSGCTSNGTIVDGNRIADNCRWSVTYNSAYPPPITGIGDCAAIQLESQGAGSIADVRITNNMIIGNYELSSVRDASPMGVLIDSTISGVEIINNSIRDVGGACVNLRPSGAVALVRNNALDACSQSSGGRCNGFACDLMADPSTAHQHSHNTYWGATPSTQVIYLPGGRGYTRDEATLYENTAVQFAPQFISATDLHLSTTSQLINAGSPDQAPATDLDGDARPLGGAVDVGADEVRP